MKDEKYTWEQNLELNNHFENFCQLFTFYICPRCVKTPTTLYAPSGPHGHHNGNINRYLEPLCSPPSEWGFYFDDIEHGCVHGVMTAFWAYLISTSWGEKDADYFTRRKEEGVEVLFSSSLLHDFLRTYGLPYAAHDELLEKYFPHLLTETYSHSNPSREMSTSPLIMADRVELQRYHNYEEWVDSKFFTLTDFFTQSQRSLMRLFYDKLRPALSFFYRHRNDAWLRHGLEEERWSEGPTPLYIWDQQQPFPPNGTYKGIDKGEKHKSPSLGTDFYPIEHDAIPFMGAAACSNHGGARPWNIIKGLIPLNTFVAQGGNIVVSTVRDHLYASSDLTAESWVFIYQKAEDRQEEIINLINGLNQGVVSQRNVLLFNNLIKLLRERLMLLAHTIKN